jgi:peptidoglycan/LPS O-acetylase OafA/YrhL
LTSTSRTTPATGFRPEIQALRALAVGLVLAFHLWPGLVPGGYAGVDVFFVVSGFLITGHLVAEVRRTGGVALGAFWARRIRRLLPAASVVLILSFVAMLAVVPRSLWERTVTEIGASALSLQNWVLASDSVDYLGADGTPTLVQHYWSLSVEEQFYVAWPLLIVGVCLVARRARIRGVAAVLAVVFVASLTYSVTQTGADQPAAYFDTFGRAWEFAAGALLSLVPAGWATRMPPAVRAATGMAGAALIVAAALLFDAQTPFPGPWAAVPVLGTLLVIAAARASRVARSVPVQWIGAVSYPLYLWHWPLIVLVPYVFGAEVDGPVGVAVLAASLVLAWLTTRLVERPLRVVTLPKRTSYLLAAAVAGLLVTGAAATTGAVQAGSASASQAALDRFATDPCYGAAAMAPGADCADPFAVPPGLDTAFAAADKGSLGQPCSSTSTAVVRCAFGETEHPRHTMVVVGNSHAGHLIAGLEAYGDEHGWRVELMRKTGCTGTSTLELTESGCREWTEAVQEQLLAREDVDVVVFATNDDSLHYLGPADASRAQLDELRAGISGTLQQLVQAGRTVVAVGDVPGAGSSPAPECVYLHRGEYDPCSTPRQPESGNLVAEAARATPGVGFVHLDPWFCDDIRCHVVIGGAVVYLDEHHLTAAFSRSLGPFLGAEIEAGMRRQG